MEIKQRLQHIRLGLVFFMIGIFTGGLLFSTFYPSIPEPVGISTKKSQDLLAENRHLRYILDLSVEFGLDPYIVTLVDQYSRRYVHTADLEWRFIRTPEYMTYLMLSLIHAESRGVATAVGDNGRARGLTQIWVSTAQQYGEVSANDLLEPETNLHYAFQHFHHLLKRYRGNVALALYSWNRGEGTVDNLLRYGQDPNNGFGKKIYEAALINNREFLVGGGN